MSASDSGQVPIEITVDELTYAQVQRDLAAIPKAVDRVLVAGVNHAATRGKTIVVDGIYGALNTKRPVIRQRISLRKARANKPEAKIIVGKSRINLIHFGARDTTNPRTHTGHGVYVRIYRDGEETNYARAFIARYRGEKMVLERRDAAVMKSSAQGLGKRLARIHGSKVGRYPIIPRVGPSPAEVLRQHPEIEQQSREKIQQDLRAQILSQLDRVLNRSKVDRPADER